MKMTNTTEKKQFKIELRGDDEVYVSVYGVKISECARMIGYAMRQMAEKNAELHKEEVTPEYLAFVARMFAEGFVETFTEGDVDDE